MSDTEYRRLWNKSLLRENGITLVGFQDVPEEFELIPEVLYRLIPDPQQRSRNEFVDAFLTAKDIGRYYGAQQFELAKFNDLVDPIDEQYGSTRDELDKRRIEEQRKIREKHSEIEKRLVAKYEKWYRRFSFRRDSARRKDLQELEHASSNEEAEILKVFSRALELEGVQCDADKKPHIATYRLNMARVLAEIMGIVPST